jgi:hypothetical protein
MGRGGSSKGQGSGKKFVMTGALKTAMHRAMKAQSEFRTDSNEVDDVGDCLFSHPPLTLILNNIQDQ